jgi:hypothetical protein
MFLFAFHFPFSCVCLSTVHRFKTKVLHWQSWHCLLASVTLWPYVGQAAARRQLCSVALSTNYYVTVSCRSCDFPSNNEYKMKLGKCERKGGKVLSVLPSRLSAVRGALGHAETRWPRQHCSRVTHFVTYCKYSVQYLAPRTSYRKEKIIQTEYKDW